MPPLIVLAFVVLVVFLIGLALLYRRRASRRPATGLRGDDVRFTLYRPGAILPERWYDLLAFAHRSNLPPETMTGDAMPEERVRKEAARLLGASESAYTSVAEDSAVPVMRQTQLTFVAEMEGVTFNPPSVMLDWIEDVHLARFQMRADARLDGRTARGHIAVFSGPLLLAEMALVIPVGADAVERAERARVEESATPYRKVFASYSHRDAGIVQQVERYARAFGDEYLRDLTTLRAGEDWDARLLEMIDEADVFQLFWSWNALASKYVRREWMHALSLGRTSFIRPVYWEDPLPSDLGRDLPPPALRALHFQRLPVMAETGPAAVPAPRAAPAADVAPPTSEPGSIVPGAPRAEAARPRARSSLQWLSAAATVTLLVTGAVLVRREMFGDRSDGLVPVSDDSGAVIMPADSMAPSPPEPLPIRPPSDRVGGRGLGDEQEPPPAQGMRSPYVGGFDTAADTMSDSFARFLSDRLMANAPRAATPRPVSVEVAEARAAGADHVITGRVEGLGTRVSVSIIDVQTRAARWTRTFAREPGESDAALTARVERAIVGALREIRSGR